MNSTIQKITDSDSGSHTTFPAGKHERCLRVGYQPNQAKGSPKPQLRFSGQWLADFGFTTGRTVKLEIEADKIIITLSDNAETTESPPVTPIVCDASGIKVLRFGRPRRFPVPIQPDT